MVDAAAALWSAVPTAGVTLTDMGPLNEDVNGADIQVNSSGQIIAPADIAPAATNYPIAVIYDADGSVIDAIFGATTSQPDACQNNGVYVWLDNFNTNATFAHGVIVLNGLCATNANMIEMMSFELERAFGRILGLDDAQVNPKALTDDENGGTLGWPVMEPMSGACGASGGACIPNPTVLRWDDIAAVNRLYPITAANLASFPGKEITAANTISIQGNSQLPHRLRHAGCERGGAPARRQWQSALPIHGDGRDGLAVQWQSRQSRDGLGRRERQPADQLGIERSFTAGILRPERHSSAARRDRGQLPGQLRGHQPALHSGKLRWALQPGAGCALGHAQCNLAENLSAGSTKTLAVTSANSAVGGYSDAIGTEAQPRAMPGGGLWCGRLSQVGQTDWFTFPVRGNRIFTVVTQALDETGAPTESKALPSIGVWDAFKPVGATAVGAAPGLNGYATGETWLRVATNGDDMVRIGVADLRGDGRPDYAYYGWVLYADTVSPRGCPHRAERSRSRAWAFAWPTP